MFRALDGDALLCLAHVISGVRPLPQPEDLFFPVGKGEIGLRDSAELFQVAVLFLVLLSCPGTSCPHSSPAHTQHTHTSFPGKCCGLSVIFGTCLWCCALW